MPSYRLLLASDPDPATNPIDRFAPDEARAVLVAHEYGQLRAMELWREEVPVPLALPANDWRHPR